MSHIPTLSDAQFHESGLDQELCIRIREGEDLFFNKMQDDLPDGVYDALCESPREVHPTLYPLREDEVSFEEFAEMREDSIWELQELRIDALLKEDSASPEDEEQWIDPVGGLHYGNEEDPAAMYK